MRMLHSVIEGKENTQPLLILHGLFGMLDNWKSLGKKWGKQYQVHLIDLRNHGKSFHDPNNSYEAMAEDLAFYMDQKDIEQAYILGHSMGGKTAMHFAALYPEKVEKLIVADIGPQEYKPHHQEIIDALQYINPSACEGRQEAEDKMSEKISTPSVRMFLLKNLYWTDDKKLDWRMNLDVLDRNYHEVTKALPSNYQFSGPTLFIRGTASGYINDDDLELIHQHFPSAKLESIEGAGHWLHAEQPKVFSEILLNFLDE